MVDVHVVVGAGALGSAVAADLVRRGQQVRVVNRTGSARIDGVQAVAADATDPAALRSAFRDAAVVYQCAQPAYHRWADEFPALQDGIIDAAAAVSASIVIADNLYPYGDPHGTVITEKSAETTTTRKGIVRRQMAAKALAAHESGRLQVALSRPSHYFGPGYDQVGSMVFTPALRGKAMRFLGRTDQPHSFSYVPDAGAAMAELGVSGGGWGRVWIPPVQPAVTQADLAARIWAAAGKSGKPRIQALGRRMAGVIGVISPTVRELPEMMYEFEKPYVVDSSAFESTFGARPTPMDDAIASTLAWYRAGDASGRRVAA